MSTAPFFRISLLIGVLTLISCQTDSSRSGSERSGGDVGDGISNERIRLTDVPPPPGIDPAVLAPLDEVSLASARLTRQEVVASLTAPPYLQPRSTPAVSRTEDQTPPLAAQKFYAAARQAMLENDNFRAVQQLEKALRLSPNEPAILRSLAEAWGRAGNRISAANFYRQAFAADPADLDSLFMLGRFALDERRWDEAIINFDTALQLAEGQPLGSMDEGDVQSSDGVDASPTADLPRRPAAARLIRFYFANALNLAGHGRAAAAMFEAFLTDRTRAAGISPYARELAMIDAQQGETLMLFGDLHHRLNEPREALLVYTAAVRVGMLNPDALRRRLLYTRLRLGQTQAAQALVAEAVADSRGDAKVLELIPYAAEHGVSNKALASQLTELYESQGRPASLVMAMADVLPPDAAAALLQDHLADRPGDDAVFGRLIRMLLGKDPTPTSISQSIRVTADAMAGSPDLAETYAERLIASAASPGVLLANFPAETQGDAAPADAKTQGDAAPADAKLSAMLAALHGKVFAADLQPDPARQQFARAIDAEPDLQLARLELADLELQRGDYDAAERWLAPLADSTHPRVAELRVRALTETGQHEDALALLDEVLQRTPPGSPLMLDKADLLLKLGRTDEAERTLLDALNARPTDESIYAALLTIYDGQGDMIRNYQRLVRRMIDTIPHARITRLVKAETLVAMRQFPAAIEVLDTLDEAEGDKLLIQRLRLETYLGTNQVESAASLIDQHLAETGDKPDEEMLNLAVRFFSRTGDRKRALELETRRWEAKPDGIQRSQTLATLYNMQGRHEDAVRVVRGAIDAGLEAQSVPMMHSILLNSLFELGRADEAEKIVEAATQKHPEIAGDLSLQLAMVYETTGDTPASRRVMEAALKQHPDHAALNNSLGYALANDGMRLDEAQRMIAVAVAAEPDTAAYLDSMGWVQYKQGRFDQAINWLERGRNAEGGTHPVILDHLGDTLYRLGRADEAVRVWNDATLIFSAEGYQPIDPEEQGMPERLDAKVTAVAEGKPAVVAAVGQGVKISEPIVPANPPLAEPNDAVEPPAAELSPLDSDELKNVTN